MEPFRLRSTSPFLCAKTGSLDLGNGVRTPHSCSGPTISNVLGWYSRWICLRSRGIGSKRLERPYRSVSLSLDCPGVFGLRGVSESRAPSRRRRGAPGPPLPSPLGGLLWEKMSFLHGHSPRRRDTWAWVWVGPHPGRVPGLRNCFQETAREPSATVWARAGRYPRRCDHPVGCASENPRNAPETPRRRTE